MGNHINNVWLNLVSDLNNTGAPTSPRDYKTKEFISHTSRIDMANPMLLIPGRKLNFRFMFGEALWILNGSNRVEDIAKYMNNIRKFSDDGITFRGAYGPMILQQLDYIVESLRKDTSTRQAVLTIWKPNPRPSKDIPCTIAMQWLIRKNKLHCITTMRSSDVWLGWVYDTFNFSMISAWIAIALRRSAKGEGAVSRLELGDLYLTAGSQHLYSRDVDRAKEVLDAYQTTSIDRLPIDLNMYDHPDELLIDLNKAADGYSQACTPFMSQSFRMMERYT